MARREKHTNNAEDVLLDLEQMISPPQSGGKGQSTQHGRSVSTPVPVLPIWQTSKSVEVPARQTARSTAYLDGLKGIACLLVYSLHHEGWSHDGMNGDFSFEKAFGVDGNRHFIALPGVRLLFTGAHYGVAIFFAISGYVLAGSLLRAIHDDEIVRLAKNVSSALFRRWIRLFLPVAATTFLWMTSWHVLGIRSSDSLSVPPEPTWFEDCLRWYYNFKNYSFVFTTGEQPNLYSGHVWTMPMEFQGSIVIYTSLLAFATFSTSKRLLCQSLLVFYFLFIVDGWPFALFSTGALLCDLDKLAAKKQTPRIFRYLKPYETGLVYTALGISLYLGGVPSSSSDIADLRRAPGWYYLSFLKPQAVFDFRWFYRYWAALLAMIAVPRISWLRSFFENTFCQYMGRICFSFYLVHGPLLWSVGDRLYAGTGRVMDRHALFIPDWINAFPFPSTGCYGLELNYLAVHLIMLPLTILCAELATKLIDEPSVRVAKWLFDSDPTQGRHAKRAP